MVRAVLPLIFATRVSAQDVDIYNQGPTTVLGCTCKEAEACKTSPIFNCFVDEFCIVEDANCLGGTAAWSLTSLAHYDWCKYEPHMPYESRSAAEKQSILLDKIARDPTPSTYPSSLGLITGLIGESVMLSFDAVADVFPHQRKKAIHSVGVVGGIQFESYGGHPYTGLFEGATSGLIRFSSAQATSNGVTPGMGIKFLRDGRKSANFVAMYTLEGQSCDDRDFFQHDWSTHVPFADNFGLKIVSAKFWQASYCPLKVGLSDLATSSADVAAARGSFPFQLIFKAKVRSECDCQDYAGCLDNLSSVSPGTQLFEVYAQAYPGADQQSIGAITLTSQLLTSSFGDEELFFQHQRMEDDFAIHPEWLESLDKKGECGMATVSTEWPSVEQGCNSPFDGSAMLSSDVTV